MLLDRHSNALHLIQRVRDEAHRFAIIHHRTLRGRASIASRLDGVPGVGEKRRKAILKHFKTVEALKAASAEDIAKAPGVPFIGGTGTISAAIVRRLVNELNWEVWLLNRGNRPEAVPEGVRQITADINDEAAVLEKLGDMTFDVVGEFIGFTPDQVERDYRLFKGKTRQYIYISSASAYHKPAAGYIITEGTTLANPHWEYSRNKIACEEFLMKKYREEGFPVTIVRPSHTYDERSVPLGVHGKNGSWQVIERMLEGKPVIIQGDGTSLWTLTFNTDFAVGYTGLMGNRHAIGEAFQITGDETLTWNQIYQTIADALGVELKPYYVSSAFLAAAGRSTATTSRAA